MRQIELNEGYMVCVLCKGFIEAGDKSPTCECLDDVDVGAEQRVYN